MSSLYDSQNILEISWAFEDFDGTKRNHGMLAEEGSRYLRQETFDLFQKSILIGIFDFAIV